ncbi:hypothetical protein O6H91_10G110300 [Diphasiastrum complanatum]|uniref:Uncharacterized protein n=2 Tax=Diphasiastrum complanatum TaxID=34168 RepID=A0ACC2CKU5_DIPCM|nr:hypothetical protein O6H91_10G110300 [Diphasiastrum complanatum]
MDTTTNQASSPPSIPSFSSPSSPFHRHFLLFLESLLHSVISSFARQQQQNEVGASPSQQGKSDGDEGRLILQAQEQSDKFRSDSKYYHPEDAISDPLTPSFCSALLYDGSGELRPQIKPEEISPYPLYKHLAAAIGHSIPHGFSSESNPAVLAERLEILHNDQQASSRFNRLGSSLLKVFSESNWQIHVQEPYFSLLRSGDKIVEGRCATGSYIQIQVGDMLLVNDSLLLIVQKVNRYSSFSEMLEKESLANVLPGVQSIAEGVNVYRKFYSEETERKGVLAFHVCRAAASTQPYTLLSKLLQELHVEGMISLLQLRINIDVIKDLLRSSNKAVLR